MRGPSEVEGNLRLGFLNRFASLPKDIEKQGIGINPNPVFILAHLC